MKVCAHTDRKEYCKLIIINIKNDAQDFEKLHVVEYIENSTGSLITYCTVPLVLCCFYCIYTNLPHLTRIYYRDTQQSDEVGAMVRLRRCISIPFS